MEDLSRKSDFANLADVSHSQRAVPVGAALLPESTPLIARIERGIAMRYTLIEDGRRQVEALVYPGDLCGLTSVLHGPGASYYEALTPVILSSFDPADLRQPAINGPDRDTALLWLMTRELTRLSGWLASVGQRNANEGIAWFVMHAWERAEAVGLIEKDSAPFPFAQQVVADSLGLSLVHTNKTIRRLRDQGLFRISGGRVRISSLPALRRAAAL
ncbi:MULTISPECIES: Crp/Fnr family transcriptional regulator [Thioclava]|uniref:HTH crp-type domain-containing protein n=1 Tax=Thioclava nitratireducens TaxID=1915078 RepID=A0ABM6IGK6_9RHOB|nr:MULTISPECIES: Crp/Fnr family transcriptional regulator [Thioclava]AQS47941.1 hypothetical protein BMG03_09050 [Thioclava nitratireducens]OWY05316.1 hypothetical protein B6V75_04140 [Thioclava sp. F1Mire-8]OWY07002.1 hypothetical protein B6V76_04335 [Thioclava sp. IC9]OWY10607.1 hypothetical protein B6V74_00840 [Thioclava sp. F42-5]OWY12587.1 hypothetical protein B6V72_11905 [Thioclava sp. F34-6]